MLTAELKVNGMLIGHVYAVNRGIVPHPTYQGRRKTKYTYEFYEVGAKRARTIKGSVLHFREEGAVKLMKKIFSQIEDRRKK